MFTCFLRYTIDPNKIDDFKEYARTWIHLIEEYGGIHHGYFIPGDASDEFPEQSFSFPGLGSKGAENIAVALFSFPSVEKYEEYKREVAQDERCKAITAYFNETKSFLSYERTFLKPMFLNESSVKEA